MPANLENSAVATGLEKVHFHSNPKERPERISKVSAKKAYFSQSFYFLVLLEGDVQYVWCKGIRNGVKRGVREGSGTLLQYSCLENPMGGEAW